MKNLKQTIFFFLIISPLIFFIQRGDQYLVFVLILIASGLKIRALKRRMNRVLEGSLLLKKKQVRISSGQLLFVVIFTLLFLLSKSDQWWLLLFPAVTLIDHLLEVYFHRDKEETVLALQEDQLIYNDSDMKTYPLQDLQKVGFSIMMNSVKIVFTDRLTIYLSSKEYVDRELHEFLAQLLVKGPEQVTVSQEIQDRLQLNKTA